MERESGFKKESTEEGVVGGVLKQTVGAHIGYVTPTLLWGSGHLSLSTCTAKCVSASRWMQNVRKQKGAILYTDICLGEYVMVRVSRCWQTFFVWDILELSPFEHMPWVLVENAIRGWEGAVCRSDLGRGEGYRADTVQVVPHPEGWSSGEMASNLRLYDFYSLCVCIYKYICVFIFQYRTYTHN